MDIKEDLFLKSLGLDKFIPKIYCDKEKLDLLLPNSSYSNDQNDNFNLGILENSKIPYPPVWDDLLRLHRIVRYRKCISILEFGVGKSTIFFSDALLRNKFDYEKYIASNIRCHTPYKLFSIDNNNNWIDECRKTISNFRNLENIYEFFCSEIKMSNFAGKICTFYDELPQISPDLIYLDAPDQYSVIGDVNGYSTRHPDSMPMSGDILAIEHFLQPGTLVVVDGRAANARFLKCNLQRNWSYLYIPEFDQHFFELLEEPLGYINKRRIDFCLGEDYFKRLELINH